ncbi:MAG: flippase-like domain-containing protein [Acidobacteria bacterium]|nr:flippase-like domain-containing protein [Acidobacteriota bacterium]
MDRKRTLLYAIGITLFAVLVYFQFRTWRNFDWTTFWSQTSNIRKIHIFHAIALIYLGYAMRAIRWKLFLRPVRPKATALQMLPPTIIGFTGLALLGRPGELIRPYLIAHKQDLSFSSQLAVWAVERIFDIGAYALLLVIALFFTPGPRELSYYSKFRELGFVLVGLVALMGTGACVLSWKGEELADWVGRRFSQRASTVGHKLALRIREFRGGLNTIHGPLSFLLITVVSLVMWCMIAVAYKEVAHAYGHPELEIPQTQVLLLMGSSMVGSLIQLPGVGGGSQLATIATLQHVFDVSPELAASCGIMLWLVTFFAIVPIGLLIAHRARLSLVKLSKESHREEEDVPDPAASS